MKCWHKALWLAVESHMTNLTALFQQSRAMLLKNLPMTSIPWIFLLILNLSSFIKYLVNGRDSNLQTHQPLYHRAPVFYFRIQFRYFSSSFCHFISLLLLLLLCLVVHLGTHFWTHSFPLPPTRHWKAIAAPPIYKFCFITLHQLWRLKFCNQNQ